MANETVRTARSMINQAREHAEDQANATANKARQEILQQRAELQAIAESQAQNLREAATGTISSLREKDQAMMAHAEAKYREQEQEILIMRKEMENIMGKNAQLETKLEKTLTLQTDLATRAQGDKDPGPGGQQDDESQAMQMGTLSRVATAVTSAVSNVDLGYKKCTARSSTGPLIDQ